MKTIAITPFVSTMVHKGILNIKSYGLPVIIIMISYLGGSFLVNPDHSFMSRLVGMLVCAIFFAIIVRFTVKKVRAKFHDKENYMGEKILSQGLMNHQRGLFARGGAGYLLNDRFVFHPHRLNLSTQIQTFLLSDIQQIRANTILFFFDNGLKITLKSGKQETFVIDRNDALYNKLLEVGGH